MYVDKTRIKKSLLFSFSETKTYRSIRSLIKIVNILMIKIKKKYNQSPNVKKNKIWIDLDNSPHVLFFVPIINELKNHGLKVIITARDYAQVIELADLYQLEYVKIGFHYGKNKILKIIGLIIRSLKMLPIIIKEKPSLALSHGARSQLLASKLLGIPSVYVLDYEHAKGLRLFHSTMVLVPEIIYKEMTKRENQKIFTYPGIKENVYIRNFIPDLSISDYFRFSKKEVVVLIRPPAMEAHYHNQQSTNLFFAVMDFIINNPVTRIILVPRDKKQQGVLKEKWSNFLSSRKIVFPGRIIDGLNLIWLSDLVISGGGTMNREAATLDVPAYTIFRGKTGAVDRYLSNNGKLTFIESVQDIHSKIIIKKRNHQVDFKDSNLQALTTIVNNIKYVLEQL
jgi:uncharacterized protein